ncbi:MAG: hypothetical protein PWQ67_489 [Clostridia bacterium]|jgi:signal transduction histidine kinase|nr:hypothetical protein [Clostridia bacterium]MDN5322035.1 hypothetical protein [Clostridia bacterium]
MVKISIRTKLFITYFILLTVIFFITTLSFNFLSQKYLIREAKLQLRNEGRLIAETLKKISIKDANLKEIVSARRELKIVGRFVESKVVVFNSDRKILFTNLELDKKQLLNLLQIENREHINGYVFEKVPVINSNSEIKGYVVLLTRVKDIKAINSLMRRTQSLSLIIAGIIAMIIGIIFGSSLIKPLNKLMKSMTGFSPKNSPVPLKIKTGDEIEELAICFNKMVNKLKSYDDQQKKFLQNTSHELKTPLMSIQGYAEAIKDGVVEGKEMEESLAIIIEESQRLKKVVEEIIYLTKLENVEDIFNFEEGNIGEVIRKAIKSVKPLLDEKNIQINLKGNFDYLGKFDSEKIKRAFINILGNCVRYAKSTIIIEVTRAGNNLEIFIKDDGPGFKDGEEKRIFDRFYKGNKGGTGLGLAITKAIIEGHQGMIEAFNNSSYGAGFKIHLPLEKI